MTKVIKRDCTEVDFNKDKIYKAILKAMKNGSGIVKEKIAADIASEIENECSDKDEVSISDIESMYAELNTKSDYCQKCGWDKEIKLIDENNQLLWECPNCGNRDVRTMDITRRTCGYKGTARNGWNQGRLGDIHDRVPHLDDIEEEN